MVTLRADVFHHQRFPELANMLRASAPGIVQQWARDVAEKRPQLREFSQEDLRDYLVPLVDAIAEAVASGDPADVHQLIEIAPRHGAKRFSQNYSVNDLIQDHSVFRWALVCGVEKSLGRRTSAEEAMVLHSAVDVALEHALQALVDCQSRQLRAGADDELKYLTYVSHDLNNNLQAVTHSLDLLRIQLQKKHLSSEELGAVDLSQRAIRETVRGMQRLLQRERVRHMGEPSKKDVLMKQFIEHITRRFELEASCKGLSIITEVDSQLHVTSDPELLSLVLQNLLGNAIKFSTYGIISVGARMINGGVKLWVRDQGPGIPLQEQAKLFHAFERGGLRGEPGVGLGLAIAWEATRLLDADLQLQSEPGRGATFSIVLHQ